MIIIFDCDTFVPTKYIYIYKEKEAGEMMMKKFHIFAKDVPGNKVQRTIKNSIYDA